MYKIYFDAYCSPKKKDRAGYCVIVEKDEKTQLIEHGILDSNITCNQAELEAMVMAIKISQTLNQNTSKQILGDSLLSVNLFNEVYKTKIDRLFKLVCLAWKESEKVDHLIRNVKWISRKYNPAGKWIEKYIRNKCVWYSLHEYSKD